MSTSSECPYCLSEINPDSPSIECESCGVLYHRECWFDNGGCCVETCAGLVRHLEVDINTDQGDLLVLTKEAVESAIPHQPERKWNPCLNCGRHVPDGALYCNCCTPEPEGSQDVRNLGPILIMFALTALLVVWFFIASTGFQESDETPESTHQGDIKR